MASKGGGNTDSNNVLLNLQITTDSKQLAGVVDTIANTLATALNTSLTKATKSFATNLGKSIQITFSDTVLGQLTKPIKLKLDTADARKQVQELVKPLRDVNAQLNAIVNNNNKPAGVTRGLAGEFQTLSKLKQDAEALGKSGGPVVTQINAITNSLKDLQAKAGAGGLFTPAQLAKIDQVIEKIATVKARIEGIKTANDQGLSEKQGIINKVTSGIPNSVKLLTELENQLKKTRAQIAAPVNKGGFDVPLTDVTRKTQRFEESLIHARIELQRLQERLKAGEITATQAGQKFQQINESLAKTKVAIDQINGKKLGDAFNSEQLDRFSKSLSSNLAVLGFTLGTVGRQLQNFGQQALQTFNQLANASQPIEQAQNIIQKNFVETGKLTQDQAKTVLASLRDIADLPSNNLVDTTKQFLRFADALGDTNAALKITKGLVTLSANTGVDKSNELAEILLQARTKFVQFNNDNFGRIQGTGGINVRKALQQAGITSPEKANEVGADAVIRTIIAGLEGLKAPLLTTADRFNILSNRVAQLGESIGKILSPALDQLSIILKDFIIPSMQRLSEIFDSLPEGTKNLISAIVVGVPVVALLAGGLIALGGSLSFAASGFLQLTKLAKLAKGEVAELGAEIVETSNVASQNAGNLLRTQGPNNVVGATRVASPNLPAFPKDFKALPFDERVKLTPSRNPRLRPTANKGTGNITSSEVVGSRIPLLRPALSEIEPINAGVTNAVKAVSSLEKAFLNVANIIGTVFKGALAPIKIAIDLVKSLAVGVFNLTERFALFFITTAEGSKGFLSFLGAIGKGGLLATFQGLFSVGKGLGGLFTSLSGGLLKILGFTNPIGIAINAILSVITALLNNFNGIRDRVVNTFKTLNDAINNLLNALGLEQGGLLYVLQLIGKAFDFVFGFIGEVVLDVLNAVLGTLRDIINNLANLITFFKKGDLINGFIELGKLVLNLVGGLIKNLIIELAASFLDLGSNIGLGIRRAIFGESEEGTTSYVADFADYLRSFNGSDKLTVANRQDQGKFEAEQAEKAKKRREDSLSFFKEESKLRKEKFQQEYDRVQKGIDALQKSSEKAREELIGNLLQSRVDAIKKTVDYIKEAASEQVELSKTLINNAVTLEETAKSYEEAVKRLKDVQNSVVRGNNQTAYLEALKEFNKLTSPTDSNKDIKAIYDLAKEGDAGFKRLADSISAVANSGDLKQLENSLINLSKSTTGIIDNDAIQSVVSKVNLILQKNNEETLNYFKEQRKIAIELRDLEIQRSREIQRQSKEFEFQRREREIANASERRDLSFQIETEKSRTVLEQSPASRATLEQQTKRIEEDEKSLRQLQADLKNLQLSEVNRQLDVLRPKLTALYDTIGTREAEAKQSGINQSITQGTLDEINEKIRVAKKQLDETKDVAAQQQIKNLIAQYSADVVNLETQIKSEKDIITSNKNLIANSEVTIKLLEKDKARLQRQIETGRYLETNDTIKSKLIEIKTTKEQIAATEKLRSQLTEEQTIRRTEGFLSGVLEFFNNLNQVSSEGLSSLFSFFDKLNNFTSDFTKFGVSSPQIRQLQDELERLIDVTKDLPGSSKLVKEYRKVLDELSSGAISSSQALNKLIDTIVKAETVQERLASSKALETLRGGILELVPDKDSKLTDEQFNAQISRLSLIRGRLLNNSIEPSAGSFNKAIGEIINDTFKGSNVEIVKSIGKTLETEIDKLPPLLFPPDLQKRIVDSLRNGDGSLKTSEEIVNTFTDIAQEVSETNPEVSKVLLNTLLKQTGATTEELAKLSQIYILFLDAEEKRRASLSAQQKKKIDANIKLIENAQSLATRDVDLQEANANIQIASIDDQLRTAGASERKRLLQQQGALRAQLIDFNYQRLDIEEAYNIEKAIIQANGNEAEIARIKTEGIARRKELQRQRDTDLQELIDSGGVTRDRNGNIIDSNGKIIKPALPTKVSRGESDIEGNITDSTAPATSEPVDSSTTRILNSVGKIRDGLDGVKNAAQGAGQALLDMYGRLASGEGVIHLFEGLIGGMSFKMEDLSVAFQDFATFAVASFGQALGQAITDVLLNGGNFLKSLKKFFGEILISMGTQLISMGSIATAIGLLALIPFFSFLDPDHTALIFGPIAIAAGVAAVLAGKALGGGQSAQTSNTNASNSANTTAGNSGQVEYDPEKDPKLIYQKALQQQVLIEVRTDDTNLVKKFIKTVNRDPRLGNLIGNRATNFAL